jgi:CxxC motif-containing protein (DUF1111 family)
VLVVTLSTAASTWLAAQNGSVDPGPRGGSPNTGSPLAGLTPGQLAAFNNGRDDFNSTHSVDGSIPGADATGLGPTFNLDNCGGCHAFPNVGGSSPAVNPQIAVATSAGANNVIPAFLTLRGPIREARFIANPDGNPDGGVHGIFTIAGRSDAKGCKLSQPDFDAALRQNNVIFRIPTPTFGEGLMENIPDATILANKSANSKLKALMGISGHENRNGNDGTITRFGWKAQNVSLMVFSGEAYNVEMGVTNELFPTERDQTPKCQLNPTPEDHPDFMGTLSAVQHFTDFMRFLAPPQPAPDTPSIKSGRNLFTSTGCAFCHTPSMNTNPSDITPLSSQPVNLFSDLLVHNMGTALADHVQQGSATGYEFRTAPLWGLGQRFFFLHDGRTSDLKAAILAHSSNGSEANSVIDAFVHLSIQQQQDLLNFLRSL